MGEQQGQDLKGEPDDRPLHEQVKERILKRIILGEWKEGDVLPSETRLATHFGVSYGTVRRAMTDLVTDGVIIRRQKTGTIVTGRTPLHSLARFYQYFRLHSTDGKLVTTEARTLDVGRREATDREAEALRIAQGETVGTLLRVRSFEGRPVMVDHMTAPLSRVPGFPQDREAAEPLLYNWLLKSHGVRVAVVREKLSARLASEEEYEWLELERGKPHALLEIRETAFDARNTPLFLMRHSALTEHHVYINEIR